jgi:hypothetical protein
MLAIEMRRHGRRDEELTAIRIRPGVRHGQQACLSVAIAEALVLELGAVDGLAARAVAVRKVASLQHEAPDYAVEGHALVVQRLAIRLANTALARAQSALQK